MPQINWDWGVDTLWDGLDNFTERTKKELEKKVRDFAPRLAEYAQANAPWEDRTGDARSGLQSQPLITDTSFGISLFHTMDYGIWLEIRWGGLYAIILPTIEVLGPELMNDISDILSGITYYD
jgi:hypothetical protein